MRFHGGIAATRNPHRFIAALIGAAALLVVLPAASQAQSVLNTAGVNNGGVTQTTWLESFATVGESSSPANTLRISMIVQHPVGREVTGLRIDDDWDTTNEGGSAAIKTVTSQQPTVVGGFGYSRVTFSYVIPTSGTDMSCGTFSGTRRTDGNSVHVRARLDNGAETGTTSSRVKFIAAGNCQGVGGEQDFGSVRSWGANNFNQQVTPGSDVTFTYACDDPDTDVVSSDDECGGMRWRRRNIVTGAVSGTATDCPDGGDNSTKSTQVNFPDRGRWVVEAETLEEDCDTSSGSYWFPLGAVDVNGAAAPSIGLSATRPNTNGNTTITANLGTDPDNAEGGRPEYVEWDLDLNGSTNATDSTLGDTFSGLTTGGGAGSPTKTINTTGLTPGVYTVRARVTDNGAMGGADDIRRTSGWATTTFTVNTPPTATPQTVSTESHLSKAVTLAATDPVNADSISSFNVTSQPAAGQGTVTPGGSGGAARTYNPPGTFAGTTNFQFTATDSFQGVSSPAAVTVNVTPQTTLDSTPPANSSSANASFSFSTPVTSAGVTFECRLDSTLETDFQPCTSPRNYSGLDDGSHTFQVRARLGTLIDPTPASYTWDLDATPPDTTITASPSDPSNDESPTFEFGSDEAGATFECRLDSSVEADFETCTSPHTLDLAGDEGEHTFEVRAVDEFDRRDPIPATYTWELDVTGPAVSIDDAPSQPSNDPTPEFAFSSTDLGATFKCALDPDEPLDPADLVPCTSPQAYGPLADGEHTFYVQAFDSADNGGGIESYTWELDTVVPDTTIDSGPDPEVASTVASFTFSSDDPSAGFQCRLDSSDEDDWEECSSPQLFADVGDGDHVLEVRATDAAANADASPDTHEWTVDTTAPQTTIDGGPSGATISTDAELAFSSDDPGATYECRIDGADWASCTSPQSYTGLADGSHTFRVRATDALGNADGTAAVRTWTVDTTAPTAAIDSAPADPSSSADPSFDFSADEPSDFECRLDGDAPGGTGWEPCGVAALTGSKSYSGLDDGAHTFEVRATDALGQTGAAAELTWTVDTTAPDVAIDSGMDDTSSTAATFEFSSTDPETPAFQCRLDEGSWQVCTSPKSYGGLDDGEHTFDVRARDEAGNTGSPASDTWTVSDSGPPNTVIDEFPDASGPATVATFRFHATEPGSTFECSLDGAAFADCTSPQAYSGLAVGNHDFRVRAVDLDDNADPSPASYDWAVTPAGGGDVRGEVAKAPVIAKRKGTLKLRAKGAAGTITCGTAACTVTRKKAKLKIGGSAFTARVKLPATIPAGGSATVIVVAPKAARTALAAAAKGVLTVKLTVTSASGNALKKLKVKVKK